MWQQSVNTPLLLGVDVDVDMDWQLKTKMDGNETGRNDDDDDGLKDDDDGVVLSMFGVAAENKDGSEKRNDDNEGVVLTILCDRQLHNGRHRLKQTVSGTSCQGLRVSMATTQRLQQRLKAEPDG